MRMIVKGAMVAGLMALGACNNAASEKAADNIEAVADNQADALENQADAIEATAENKADALENKADAIEENAEAKADAIEDNGQ